jgi:hypothetical protein
MVNKDVVWLPVYIFSFVLIVIGGYAALTQDGPAATATASGAGLPISDIDETLSQARAAVDEAGFSVKLVEVFSLHNRRQDDNPANAAPIAEEPLSEEAIRGQWAADKSRRQPSLDLVEEFTFSDTRQPDSPLNIAGTLSLWQGDHDYLILSLEVSSKQSEDHLAQQANTNNSE